ncbi:MAG: YHYH protein [Parasphingorhabdus sp.]
MLKKTIYYSTGCLAFGGLLGFAAVSLSAQQGPPRGQRGGDGRPTDAMLKACSAKQADDSCTVSGEGGASTEGTCRAPQGRPLACVSAGGPNGGPPGGGGPGGAGGPPMGASNTGDRVSNVETYTMGILCNYAADTTNPKIGLTSKAQWACARGQRTLTANGIPDHDVGQFPSPANPNKISAQTVRFTVTTSPVQYSGPGGRVKEPVMGLNGIKFDPGTGGSCKDDITDPAQCPLGPGGGGRWNIEALGQDLFDFGEDANHAHVQPGGAYHYHGVPDGMLSADAKAGKQMAIIGWAADGFPVYARYGYPKAGVMLAALKLMAPSYRLKQTPDSGRPSVAIVPMGTFMQDWEFVEGLGDLDECNGRFGSTPEFPQGIYHYYATDAYPYVQRCVKGSIDSEPTIQRQGAGPGGGGGKGRPKKGGGNRPPPR